MSGENLRVRGWGASPHAGIYASLFLTSAGLLALEVSLTRFFSYTIWYHFAYLTISVALLGFGSSGALVAAFPDVFRRYGVGFLVTMLVIAAALTVGGLVYLAGAPIEVKDLMDRPGSFTGSLLVYYLIVGSPFLLAGFSVSVPFAAYPERMGRLYFWDLLGAACGCGVVGLLIETMTVPGLIFAAGGLLLLSASALALGSGRKASGVALAVVGLVVMGGASTAGRALPISITSSKGLSAIKTAKIGRVGTGRESDSFSKWTAINRVDAMGWEQPSTVSWWGRLGRSQKYQGPKPATARLTYDGSNGSDIFSSQGDVQTEFAMLEQHLLRVPYLVTESPDVLVIGVGGGIDMFNAVKQGARHVTGVELQPETVKLLRDRLRDFTSGFYDRDDVTLIPGEGRHFVRKTDRTFDLVQITTVDTFAAQATGAYVLAESYLYTVEAVEDYFRRLSDDGLVSFVIGDLVSDKDLPALGTRLALIGYRALERSGVASPGRHLLMVGARAPESLSQDQVVLVSKSPLTMEKIDAVRRFADEYGFEVLYAPDGKPSRFSAVFGDDEAARQQAIDDEWFRIDATYDTNPFFYNIGKWSHFSPSSNVYFSMPGSFMGQLVLLIMVAQSLVLGAVLILLPLLRGAREGLRAPRVATYLVYFLALGIGFMFIEISFVQSFVLFLGSPTYALSVTILALLLFSSFGSFFSTRFADRPTSALRWLRFLVAGLVCIYTVALAPFFAATIHLDLPVRILIAILVQMPMGLTLGMFMPLGIACVARESPRLVPWAWGINGVGSVVGTTLAVLLAMAAGFPTVSLTAAALYVIGTTLVVRANPA